MLMVQWYFQCC